MYKITVIYNKDSNMIVVCLNSVALYLAKDYSFV